jgi:uncharacterized protein
MTEILSQTVYFAAPGPQNTDRVLSLVAERAQALDISTILVATTSGATGARAAEQFAGLDSRPRLGSGPPLGSRPRLVVAVTHSAGFREPYTLNHDAALCEQIKAAGGKILTTTHAFGGVGRAVRKKLGTYQIDEIIAFTLRCFGQGMKVAAEITLMASDAGLLQGGEPIIAIGGSGRGADTAVVLQPTHAQTFFDLRILEIICMVAPGHPAFGTIDSKVEA